MKQRVYDVQHCMIKFFYLTAEAAVIQKKKKLFRTLMVKNERLLHDIGLKTKVDLHDILEVVRIWRKSMTTFYAMKSRKKTLSKEGVVTHERLSSEGSASGHARVKLPPGVPFFTHITQNDFVDRKNKKLKEEDIAVCICEWNVNLPDNACEKKCLNVMSSIECTPGNCSCGDACQNQKFLYARTKLFQTADRGWGMLADENIKAGQFIIEYCGEVISSDEAKLRSQSYAAEGLKDAYIISLNANFYIDATKKGNLGRFINHSCQPNCETRKRNVLGEIRVGIFAKKDINIGTELTYDYNFEWYGGENIRCLCGASNCLKFLGAKSAAFLEKNHVWEEGDHRYKVEEVPLYDSEDDEKPDHRDNVKNDLPLPPMSNNIIGSASSRVKSKPAKAFTFNAQGSVNKRKAQQKGKESTSNGSSEEEVDAKRVAKLFKSKKAQVEILKCEEIRSEAASKLNSVYDEIRPTIEEFSKDEQDKVDNSLTKKWIEANCAKLKADFNLRFSIVKNTLLAPPKGNTEE